MLYFAAPLDDAVAVTFVVGAIPSATWGVKIEIVETYVAVVESWCRIVSVTSTEPGSVVSPVALEAGEDDCAAAPVAALAPVPVPAVPVPPVVLDC